MIPLLLLLVAQFVPKPEWNPFQETKISLAQHGFAVVAVMLWPAEIVAEFLGMVVTDSGGDSSVVISAVPICDFNSSECCGLCGNWIDSLAFPGSIFPFLSTALAKVALASVQPLSTGKRTNLPSHFGAADYRFPANRTLESEHAFCRAA